MQVHFLFPLCYFILSCSPVMSSDANHSLPPYPYTDAVSPKINAIPIVELADYVKTHQVLVPTEIKKIYI